jgi:hypothetical protein
MISNVMNHEQWILGLSEKLYTAHEIIELAIKMGAPFVWHPLGFLMCKLSQEEGRNIRLHIWPDNNDKVQEPAWLIHDHLFELKSWVLAGSIENIEYEVVPGKSNYSIYHASYEHNRSILNRTEKTVNIIERNRFVVDAGDVYQVATGVLHQSVSLYSGTAVTVCETIDKHENQPAIVGDLTGQSRYSYTRSIVDRKDLNGIVNKI